MKVQVDEIVARSGHVNEIIQLCVDETTTNNLSRCLIMQVAEGRRVARPKCVLYLISILPLMTSTGQEVAVWALLDLLRDFSRNALVCCQESSVMALLSVWDQIRAVHFAITAKLLEDMCAGGPGPSGAQTVEALLRCAGGTAGSCSADPNLRLSAATALRRMASFGPLGPRCYFLFVGDDNGLTIDCVTWPFPGSFTFVVWVCFDVFEDQQRLLTIKDVDRNGIELSVSSAGLVSYTVKSHTKALFAPTHRPLEANRWYCIALVHEHNSIFRSEAHLYIDGNQVGVGVMKYPSFSKPLCVFSIGTPQRSTIAPRNKSVVHVALRGAVAMTHVFNSALPAETLRQLHSDGFDGMLSSPDVLGACYVSLHPLLRRRADNCSGWEWLNAARDRPGVPTKATAHGVITPVYQGTLCDAVSLLGGVGVLFPVLPLAIEDGDRVPAEVAMLKLMTCLDCHHSDQSSLSLASKRQLNTQLLFLLIDVLHRASTADKSVVLGWEALPFLLPEISPASVNLGAVVMVLDLACTTLPWPGAARVQHLIFEKMLLNFDFCCRMPFLCQYTLYNGLLENLPEQRRRLRCIDTGLESLLSTLPFFYPSHASHCDRLGHLSVSEGTQLRCMLWELLRLFLFGGETPSDLHARLLLEAIVATEDSEHHVRTEGAVVEVACALPLPESPPASAHDSESSNPADLSAVPERLSRSNDTQRVDRRKSSTDGSTRAHTAEHRHRESTDNDSADDAHSQSSGDRSSRSIAQPPSLAENKKHGGEEPKGESKPEATPVKGASQDGEPKAAVGRDKARTKDKNKRRTQSKAPKESQAASDEPQHDSTHKGTTHDEPQRSSTNDNVTHDSTGSTSAANGKATHSNRSDGPAGPRPKSGNQKQRTQSSPESAASTSASVGKQSKKEVAVPDVASSEATDKAAARRPSTGGDGEKEVVHGESTAEKLRGCEETHGKPVESTRRPSGDAKHDSARGVPQPTLAGRHRVDGDDKNEAIAANNTAPTSASQQCPQPAVSTAAVPPAPTPTVAPTRSHCSLRSHVDGVREMHCEDGCLLQDMVALLSDFMSHNANMQDAISDCGGVSVLLPLVSHPVPACQLAVLQLCSSLGLTPREHHGTTPRHSLDERVDSSAEHADDGGMLFGTVAEVGGGLKAQEAVPAMRSLLKGVRVDRAVCHGLLKLFGSGMNGSANAQDAFASEEVYRLFADVIEPTDHEIFIEICSSFQAQLQSSVGLRQQALKSASWVPLVHRLLTCSDCSTFSDNYPFELAKSIGAAVLCEAVSHKDCLRYVASAEAHLCRMGAFSMTWWTAVLGDLVRRCFGLLHASSVQSSPQESADVVAVLFQLIVAVEDAILFADRKLNQDSSSGLVWTRTWMGCYLLFREDVQQWVHAPLCMQVLDAFDVVLHHGLLESVAKAKGTGGAGRAAAKGLWRDGGHLPTIYAAVMRLSVCLLSTASTESGPTIATRVALCSRVLVEFSSHIQDKSTSAFVIAALFQCVRLMQTTTADASSSSLNSILVSSIRSTCEAVLEHLPDLLKPYQDDTPAPTATLSAKPPPNLTGVKSSPSLATSVPPEALARAASGNVEPTAVPTAAAAATPGRFSRNARILSAAFADKAANNLKRAKQAMAVMEENWHKDSLDKLSTKLSTATTTGPASDISSAASAVSQDHNSLDQHSTARDVPDSAHVVETDKQAVEAAQQETWEHNARALERAFMGSAAMQVSDGVSAATRTVAKCRGSAMADVCTQEDQRTALQTMLAEQVLLRWTMLHDRVLQAKTIRDQTAAVVAARDTKVVCMTLCALYQAYGSAYGVWHQPGSTSVSSEVGASWILDAAEASHRNRRRTRRVSPLLDAFDHALAQAMDTVGVALTPTVWRAVLGDEEDTGFACDLVCTRYGELRGYLRLVDACLEFYPCARPIPRHPSFAGDAACTFRWSLSTCCEISLRRYLMQHHAVELFLDSGRTSLFFNFNKNDSPRACAEILGAMNTVGAPPVGEIQPKVAFKRRQLTQLWQRWKLSTFDYLRALNHCAGRTHNDLSQYPVFPWVLSDYSSATLDLSNPRVFRDLSKPVGALNPARLTKFQQRMDDADGYEMQGTKFLYGTHYSTEAIVLWYLTRLEPFGSLAQELHGGTFDHTARQFLSVKQAWENGLSSATDVKELVPEFFYLPDFLRHSHRTELDDLGDVQLPPWAEGSPEQFIRLHREALESEYVSAHIHKWIDLVFGIAQTGDAAHKANNIFPPSSYEGTVDLTAIDDVTERDSWLTQIRHFGQTPSQVFFSAHPKRDPKPQSAGGPASAASPPGVESGQPPSLLDPASIIRRVSPITQLAPPGGRRVLALHAHKGGRALTLVCESLMVQCASLSPRTSQMPLCVERDVSVVNGERLNYDNPITVAALAANVAHSAATVAVADGHIVVVAGFADESFNVYSAKQMKRLQHINKHCGTVTCVALCENGRRLVTAAAEDTLMVWAVDTSAAAEPVSGPLLVLRRRGQVVHVSVSESTDTILALYKDGTCSLFSLCDGLLVRTFVLPLSSFSKVPNQLLPPAFSVVTALGYFVFLSASEQSLHVFDNNGHFISRAATTDDVADVETSQRDPPPKQGDPAPPSDSVAARASCCCVSPDGLFVATGYTNGAVVFRHLPSLDPLCRVKCVSEAIFSVAFGTTPDNESTPAVLWLGLARGRIAFLHTTTS